MAEKKLPKGVTQRKDGRYMGRFMYHGEQYTVYGEDARKTKKKLDDLRYEVEHNVYEKPSKLTVDKWFNEWMNVYKIPTVRVNTIRTYKNSYRHISAVIGKKYIADVRAHDLQKVYNVLAEKGYSDGTIHTVRKLANGMFSQAYKNKIITENPVEFTGAAPKGKKSIRRYALTKEEQEVFLRCAERYAKELYNIFCLGLCTGMRSGELRGLRWKDIDFKERVIHVTGTLIGDTKKEFFRGEPKTQSSYRDIPMIDKAYEALKDERKRQLHNKLRMGDKWQPLEGLEDLVFLSKEGAPRCCSHMGQTKDRILARMKKEGYEINDFSVHSLRHTFATRAIENGMKPQTLKAILGHSKLSLTMDLYSHVLSDTKREEMELIKSAF